jgi:hypothetical protein
MSFASESIKSVNDFRTLIQVDYISSTSYLRECFSSADISTAGASNCWDNRYAIYGTTITLDGEYIKGAYTAGPSNTIMRLMVDPRSKHFRVKIKSSVTTTVGLNNDSVNYNFSLIANVWQTCDVSFDGTGTGLCDVEANFTGSLWISRAYVYSGDLYSGRFSFNEFTPTGESEMYEGRVLSSPQISIERDSSMWGVLVYGASGISLNNADGYFDTIIETYKLIGASVRIFIGYKSLDYSDYINIFTGYISNIRLNETTLDLTIGDNRKKLQTGSSIDLNLVDAVQGIENILVGNYAVTASSTYFDLTAWNAAKALDKPIYRLHPDNDTVDMAIEDCVKSTMGFFYITGSGKYSYKMIDTAATSATTIKHNDIINPINITYDSDNILASVSTESKCWSPRSKYAANVGEGFYHNGYHGFVASGIIRSADNGTTWTTHTASTGSTIKDFADSTTAGTIYLCNRTAIGFGATSYSNVFKSIDSSSSWTSFGFIPAYANCMAIGNAYEIIIGGSGVATTAAIIYRATAGSTIFSVVLNNPHISGSAIYSMESSLETDNSLLVKSSGVNSIVAVGEYNKAACAYYSIDGGLTWATSTTSFADFPTSRSDHVKALTDKIYVMAAYDFPTQTSVKIYYSDDYGNSWCKVLDIAATGVFNFKLLADNSLLLFLRRASNTIMVYRSEPDIITKVPGISWNYLYEISVLETYSSCSLTGIAHNWNNGITLVGIFTGYSSSSSIYYMYVDSNTQWALNNTHNASTYSQYGIDVLKYFNTYLAYHDDATTMASDLIDYYKDLHGEFTINIPMKYYTINIGENVDVEIWREAQSMLGTKKCEVMGISYDLVQPGINLKLRII